MAGPPCPPWPSSARQPGLRRARAFSGPQPGPRPPCGPGQNPSAPSGDADRDAPLGPLFPCEHLESCWLPLPEVSLQRSFQTVPLSCPLSSPQKSRQHYTLSAACLLSLLSLEGPPQHPDHTPPSLSPSHTWLLLLLPQAGPGHHPQDHALPPQLDLQQKLTPLSAPWSQETTSFLSPKHPPLGPYGAWARLQSRLPCMSPPEISSGPGLSPRHASLLSCDFIKIYEPCRVSSGLDPALRLRSHLHMEPRTVGTSQRIASICPLLPAPSSLAHRGWNTGGSQ